MKKILLCLTALLAAGCASVSVQRYDQDTLFAPTRAAGIRIYAQKPYGSGFTEIGEITVEGASEWSQVEKVFRKKAAEMGGNAVYVFSKKEEISQYVSPGSCAVRSWDYYPYGHFGWRRYRHGYHYPRGHYYCYGYPPSIETTTYISAVGIVIRYT